jgi:hypothetical protein
MHNASRARLLLAFLLICQAALLLRPSQPFNGDEPYYAGKAQFFFEHGRFEHVSAEAMAVERGERWGTSDWRPQGYPLFLAAVSLGDFRDASLRPRVTAVQFVLIAAGMWLLFEINQRGLTAAQRITTAALLGVIPWPYDFAGLLTSDSLTAGVTFLGIVMLWHSLQQKRIALTCLSAFLLSMTLLLRPEMIALAPVILAPALLTSRSDRRLLLKRATACAAAFLLVVALQVCYRMDVTGRPGLFGGQHLRDSGAFAWVHSWLGTENEGYNFVYGLWTGQVRDDLPARAFAGAEERRIVHQLIQTDRSQGHYSAGLDAAFRNLAEKRKREHPFLSIFATRAWHTAHLWLNLETSSQLLKALANVPRPVRLPILGTLMAVKLIIITLFVVGIVRHAKSANPELVVICAAAVIGRTLLISIPFNWMAHRFVLTAWLPLLACAIAGLQTWPWRRHVDQPLSGDPALNVDR